MFRVIYGLTSAPIVSQVNTQGKQSILFICTQKETFVCLYILHNRMGYKILKPGNYWHSLFTRHSLCRHNTPATHTDRDTFTQIQILINHSNQLWIITLRYIIDKVRDNRSKCRIYLLLIVHFMSATGNSFIANEAWMKRSQFVLNSDKVFTICGLKV